MERMGRKQVQLNRTIMEWDLVQREASPSDDEYARYVKEVILKDENVSRINTARKKSIQAKWKKEDPAVIDSWMMGIWTLYTRRRVKDFRTKRSRKLLIKPEPLSMMPATPAQLTLPRMMDILPTIPSPFSNSLSTLEQYNQHTPMQWDAIFPRPAPNDPFVNYSDPPQTPFSQAIGSSHASSLPIKHPQTPDHDLDADNPTREDSGSSRKRCG